MRRINAGYVTCAVSTLGLMAVTLAASQDRLMPEGFRQVHIGMDWRSLVELRPSAHLFKMLADPNEDRTPNPAKPEEGLIEELDGELYERVMYVFEHDALVGVSFVKIEERALPGEREKVIRGVVSEEGMPTRIQVAGNRRDQGILAWERDKLHIIVLVPTADADAKRALIGLQIRDRVFAERTEAPGVVGYAETRGRSEDDDMRRLASRRLESLRSGIEQLVKHITPAR